MPVPWPLVLGLLAIIAAMLLAALLSGQGSDEPTSSREPAPSSPTQASPTPTATPTPTQEPGIEVDEADYVGADRKDVEKQLKALGLEVDTQEIDNPGGHDKDEVAGVAPTGTLAEGDTVVVTYYGKPPKDDHPGQGSGNGKGNKP